MLWQSLFLALIVVFLSCGQSARSPAAKTDTGSTVPKETAVEDSAVGATPAVTTKLNSEGGGKEINDLPPSLLPFIPAGYTALDTTAGDLNLDAYPDLVMVLKKNGEEKTSDVSAHPEKRPLLVLLGQADASYKLAARSDNAVYCIDCGGVMGDPFMNVVISKGYFSVEHYGGSGWRWTRTVTFKYSPQETTWYLHKDGGDSFHASEPDKVTTKVKTTKHFGKVPFAAFDIYKEEEER